MQHIKFYGYTPEAFGGINYEKAKDMMIVFPENKPIVELSGDQGIGKTSNLQCLSVLLGAPEPGNAINRDDNDKKATLEWGDPEGNRYITRQTKSSFTVTMIQNNEGHTLKSAVSSPKEFLRKKIGNIGISPMGLKDMKGKEQIEWMRKMHKPTAEQLKTEQEITAAHQAAYDKRTIINRDLGRLQTEVKATPYYLFDADNKVFTGTEQLAEDRKRTENVETDYIKLQQQFNTAFEKSNAYQRAINGVDQFKAKKSEAELKIEALRAKILELEKEIIDTQEQIVTYNSRIEDGEQYLNENCDVVGELEAAQKKLFEAGELRLIKQNIDQATEKYSKYLEVEQEKVNIEGKLSEYTVILKKLVQAMTPDIDGLELHVATLDAEKAEGIYYHDRTMQELSESEIWQLYLELCRALNIRITFIENISSLGTDAIETINDFVAGGGTVFCSKMERGQKELSVTFYDQYN